MVTNPYHFKLWSRNYHCVWNAIPITGPNTSLRLREFLDNRYNRWLDFQPYAPAGFTRGNFLVLISVRGWVDLRVIMRPEGLSQWNIPMTPSEIEPETLWLLTKCFNQLRHYVPHDSAYLVDWYQHHPEYGNTLYPPTRLFFNTTQKTQTEKLSFKKKKVKTCALFIFPEEKP